MWFEKRWGGGFFQKKTVDYLGVAWGIPFAIEIKHPDYLVVLDDHQYVFLEKFERAGGRTLATNKLQRVKDFMARLHLLGAGIEVPARG